MGKITPKQRRFIDEYLVDLNATQAAIRAGYSPKTARFIGNENLTKPDIRGRIQRGMDERSKRTCITQDMVIEELARIAFADICNFLTYRTEKTVVDRDKETGDPIIDYAQIIDLTDSQEVDGKVIQEISVNSRGMFTFKLHDKMAALDKLGKHLGIFTENFKITKTPINPFESLTTDELKKLIAK